MEKLSSRGPFCQSCGMPLEVADQFGTDKAGMRINEYCVHCYHDGAFTEPDITRDEMIERGTAMMVERGDVSPERAREKMRASIPRLKRWRSF